MSYPILHYTGAKWRIAPWVISHFPSHQIYVEPFGGSGAILFNKKPSKAEFYNDINGRMVNLFRVLQDPDETKHLVRMLTFTLFSRDEYKRAWRVRDDDIPVVKAWALITLSLAAQGSCPTRESRQGFYCATDQVNQPANSRTYRSLSRSIWDWYERFKYVVVENRDAFSIINQFNREDRPQTLIYCDPPYVPETFAKSSSHIYGKEGDFTYENHVQLLDILNDCKVSCVLSGYPSKLYSDKLRDWKRFIKGNINQKGKIRCECLWVNKYALQKLQYQGSLL